MSELHGSLPPQIKNSITFRIFFGQNHILTAIMGVVAYGESGTTRVAAPLAVPLYPYPPPMKVRIR